MSTKKHDPMPWVVEALGELRWRGTVVEVSEVVWERRELDLRNSGTLFYIWQYDIRWAAQSLRDSGRLKPIAQRRPGVPWGLA